ncbi:hypothetical protein V5E97_24435 [Singulisphaera sp. Ch08]|uniref:Uncharacterized protein n=1 Tax=Singulisphaera sp. Ch08 TaxID=3120278 RepID=A0AAU7C7W7_9BACT
MPPTGSVGENRHSSRSARADSGGRLRLEVLQDATGSLGLGELLAGPGPVLGEQPFQFVGDVVAMVELGVGARAGAEGVQRVSAAGEPGPR